MDPIKHPNFVVVYPNSLILFPESKNYNSSSSETVYTVVAIDPHLSTPIHHKDKVLIDGHSAKVFNLNGNKYYLVNINQIVAIIK